jgi:dihydroorotase
VISNHVPLEEERKKLEFAYADFGAIGLETCYALLNTHLKHLGAEKMTALMGGNAREIFGLPTPIITEGEEAELTFFLPEFSWQFTKDDIGSKSKNTPLLKKSFTGKVLGIVNRQKSHFSPLR